MLYEVRMDDNEDRYGNSRYVGERDLSYHITWCEGSENANNYIKKEINKILEEMAKDLKTYEEFINEKLYHPVSFYIIKKGGTKEFFPSSDYIKEISPSIWENIKSKNH